MQLLKIRDDIIWLDRIIHMKYDNLDGKAMIYYESDLVLSVPMERADFTKICNELGFRNRQMIEYMRIGS